MHEIHAHSFLHTLNTFVYYLKTVLEQVALCLSFSSPKYKTQIIVTSSMKARTITTVKIFANQKCHVLADAGFPRNKNSTHR